MKIGFIGGGNMAEAIIGGVINAGLCKKNEVFVCDKNVDTLKKYDSEINTSQDNKDALSGEFIILAVKPSIIPLVLDEIKSFGKEAVENKVFVSIAAGVKLLTIKEVLGKKAKVVRVMPNTPALVGQGMTALASKDKNVSDEEFNLVIKIFDAVGKTEVVSEELLNTVTAISGSSPPYVYMLIEAMADAGVSGGIPRDVAYKMAAQSVLGSAKMVLESGKHPGELKDMVCSPKGTTIEAVAELEKRGFRSAVIEAMKKCKDKADNLGK